MDCSVTSGLTQSAEIVVCYVQAPDWRIYVTPALVFLSAIIAYLAIRNTRAVARQKATLDLIEKVESAEHYRQRQAIFSRLRREHGLASLARPQTEDDRINRQAVMDYLNHYELISLGIRQNILDETFYRAWMRGPFVRDWNAARDLIQRQRWKQQEDGSWTYHRQTFQNYQIVARRWSSEAADLTAASGGPPSAEEAGGPGDEPLPPPMGTDGEEVAAGA